MRSLGALTSIVLLMAASACTSEDAPAKRVRPDGGVVPPEDAAVLTPAGSIRGRAIDTYVTESGEQQVAADLTGVTIAAYVESAGSFVRFEGTGTSTGTFHVAAVPAGPLTLQVGSSYLVTSARDLDLGVEVLGRPDVTVLHAPTTLELHARGLAPWTAGDGLELMVLNAGMFGFGLEGLTSLAEGATSLDGLAVDLTAVADPQAVAIEAGKGDEVVVTQLVDAAPTSTSATYRSVAGIFRAAAVTLTEGMTVPASGAFTAVPQTSTVAITWLRSETAGLRAGLNPNAVPESQSLYLEAQIGGAVHGNFSGTPDLVLSTPIPGSSDIDLGVVRYGNPFPATWSLILGFSDAYFVPYSLPGARRAAKIPAYVFAQARLGAQIGSPVRPLVGPVSAPRVNGADAFSGLTKAGLHPVLSWAPPALGTPTEYQVTIRHLTKDGTTQHTKSAVVGALQTKATRVRIPPDVLQAGQPYVFQITALANAGHDVETRPNRVELTQAGATVVTGIVVP